MLVGVALALTALIDPSAAGIGQFAITSTTIGLVLVALLTTPLQAAGEELLFRGAMMPLFASWVRAVRPALVLGMIASSIAFGLVHMSVDPWLLSYYAVFGLCMAAMAVISRGLEAPIAFHVMNNLIMMVVGALFAGAAASSSTAAWGWAGRSCSCSSWWTSWPSAWCGCTRGHSVSRMVRSSRAGSL